MKMSSGNSDGLLEIDVRDWSDTFEMVYCEPLVYCVLLRGESPPPPQKLFLLNFGGGAPPPPTNPPTPPTKSLNTPGIRNLWF